MDVLIKMNELKVPECLKNPQFNKGFFGNCFQMFYVLTILVFWMPYALVYGIVWIVKQCTGLVKK